jgi:hypothetical protein
MSDESLFTTPELVVRALTSNIDWQLRQNDDSCTLLDYSYVDIDRMRFEFRSYDVVANVMLTITPLIKGDTKEDLIFGAEVAYNVRTEVNGMTYLRDGHKEVAFEWQDHWKNAYDQCTTAQVWASRFSSNVMTSIQSDIIDCIVESYEKRLKTLQSLNDDLLVL